MTLGSFEDAGTLDRPGPIGRSWRVVNGVGVFAIIAWIVANFSSYVSSDTPSLLGAALITFGVVAALLNFSSTVNIGFTRNWGLWPVKGVAVAFLAAAAFDLIQYDHVWGPPVGLLAFMFMVSAFGHLGLSFLAAGIFAVPG